MRKPARPPSRLSTLRKLDPDRLMTILSKVARPTHKDRYLHWDKLRRLNPPDDLSAEEWWAGLKWMRDALLKEVPLKDAHEQPFKYALPDRAQELLHQIDQGAAGLIGMDDQSITGDMRDRYIVSSLIEESIRSSQLEGAATTRAVAKEMIRSGRQPRDRSEKMILNNFTTMRQIRQLLNEPLSRKLILDVHRSVTRDALDDPTGAGRLRRREDNVHIEDIYGDTIHTPPPANELPDRLEALCDFANHQTPKEFVHPVIRAIIVHFWLAYDHPFIDGNGRCARALFYWSMLKEKYWLCEYISISQVIRKAPIQYYRAFLYTETDENDLTYFVMYHLGIIHKAIDEVHKYITRKGEELRQVERHLRATVSLNYRQRALISHALRHPDARYSIRSHRLSHSVVYQTARTDLLDLEKRRLLTAIKIGRTWYFQPVKDMEKRMETLN